MRGLNQFEGIQELHQQTGVAVARGIEFLKLRLSIVDLIQGGLGGGGRASGILRKSHEAILQATGI